MDDRHILEDKKKKLTPEQYNICFLKGTEPPFSGKYSDNKQDGMYVCVVCGKELFASDTKYDSKTGWPSFWSGLTSSEAREGARLQAERRQAWQDGGEIGNLKFQNDNSLGMHRVEVLCKNCGSHLGHVFDDGPTALPDGRQATGKRYCINSLALDFKPSK